MALLDDVKAACRVKSTAYDYEFNDLITAAFADLGITDIQTVLLVETGIKPLIKQAVITYCKIHFGNNMAIDYVRLKESYDEQKAQLSMATGYTDWS